MSFDLQNIKVGSSRRLALKSAALLHVVVPILFLLAGAAVLYGLWWIWSGAGSMGGQDSAAVATLMDVGHSICADVSRAVAPAMSRTQKLAEDPNVIAALREGGSKQQTQVCNQAIAQSTEIDAVALFNAQGHIVAINTIYANGQPIAAERVNRILAMNFDNRNIIHGCLRNNSNGKVLEFQTTCDITPAFFDSTGLSVAYSAPVIDPSTGKKLGVVSSRLRFERLTDLVKNRFIAGRKGAAEFVTDQGKYFSEKINSGQSPPPVESTVLAGVVAPLIQNSVDYTFARRAGEYLGLFRLKDFNTLEGGGIQVMLIAGDSWIAGQTRLSRLLRGGAIVAAGICALLAALLGGGLASFIKLQSRTAETVQQMHMALDAGTLGSWDWNFKTDFIVFDERCAAQLGLGNTEFSIHPLAWESRLHPEEIEQVKATARDYLSGRTGVYSCEHRVRHADGTWRWILDCGKVVERSADGSPSRMVGIQADITERKAAEAALAQARKLESIGQLAAGIAHEINTPVQYVGDNTRFVRDGVTDLLLLVDRAKSLLDGKEAARGWAERTAEMASLQKSLDLDFLLSEIPKAIDQSIDGLNSIAHIVKAMKEFSHPGGDAKEFADLNAAIDNTVTVCRNRWKYVAELELQLDPKLPMVPVLLGEFNQVILNLVVNAADAIAEAGSDKDAPKGQIRIATCQVEQGVEIRISDNGPGIPDLVKPRIFEPFFTTKPVGKGTGQGLAISRNVIVGKHGGKLDFESTAGGTSFIIRLPLVDGVARSREAA